MSEFSEQVPAIQDAIDNDWKIRFDYKKPSDKTYTTRVVVPERLFNIPHTMDDGERLCVGGFCELRQNTRVFALERMRGLTVIVEIAFQLHFLTPQDEIFSENLRCGIKCLLELWQPMCK